MGRDKMNVRVIISIFTIVCALIQAESILITGDKEVVFGATTTNTKVCHTESLILPSFGLHNRYFSYTNNDHKLIKYIRIWSPTAKITAKIVQGGLETNSVNFDVSNTLLSRYEVNIVIHCA